jgi:serine/threonine protein kinase
LLLELLPASLYTELQQRVASQPTSLLIPPFEQNQHPHRTASKNVMNLDEIRKLSVQLMCCLQFLEKQHVIHADLKPENILLRTPLHQLAARALASPSSSSSSSSSFIQLVVADFGNAMTTSESRAYYDDFELQSLFYRAPEVLLGCHL